MLGNLSLKFRLLGSKVECFGIWGFVDSAMNFPSGNLLSVVVVLLHTRFSFWVHRCYIKRTHWKWPIGNGPFCIGGGPSSLVVRLGGLLQRTL